VRKTHLQNKVGKCADFDLVSFVLDVFVKVTDTVFTLERKNCMCVILRFFFKWGHLSSGTMYVYCKNITSGIGGLY